MLQRPALAPDCVYALVDHLDATLTACEDLLRLSGRDQDMEWFLASVRRFEVAAILQVLRVRQYAEELRQSEPRIATVAELFLAGTLAFTEASGAQVTSPFATDMDPNGHGLLITEQFMIGRRIPIGLLGEMVSAFLDALDITYVLLGDDHEPRPVRGRPPLNVVPSVVVPFQAANSRPQA
jgi:hypothetical protein